MTTALVEAALEASVETQAAVAGAMSAPVAALLIGPLPWFRVDGMLRLRDPQGKAAHRCEASR